MTASIDDKLTSQLPGFSNKYVDVNGTTLHVVEGGRGAPILLLPGWPQTWWAYHKIMPALAARFKVLAVDVRGMGSSSNPENGYDKKNMALDIYELIKQYGFDQVSIAGHDISSTVVHSFAAQFPHATTNAIFLDTPPIDENIHRLPILPPLGQSGHIYPWWLSFNQVQELPEKLLEGRSEILLNYLFDNLTADKDSISPEDRLIYSTFYDQAKNIRSANKWYQAFPQDVVDSKSYEKLTMPVLGVYSAGNPLLEHVLLLIAQNPSNRQIQGSGHFVMEEKPEEVVEAMLNFLL
jgi:pimeloyl-ACP methyl ester carboxylesterase